MRSSSAESGLRFRLGGCEDSASSVCTYFTPEVQCTELQASARKGNALSPQDLNPGHKALGPKVMEHDSIHVFSKVRGLGAMLESVTRIHYRNPTPLNLNPKAINPKTPKPEICPESYIYISKHCALFGGVFSGV